MRRYRQESRLLRNIHLECIAHPQPIRLLVCSAVSCRIGTSCRLHGTLQGSRKGGRVRQKFTVSIYGYNCTRLYDAKSRHTEFVHVHAPVLVRYTFSSSRPVSRICILKSLRVTLIHIDR